MIPDSGKITLSDETVRIAIEEYLNRKLRETAQIAVLGWRFGAGDVVAEITPKAVEL